MAGLDGKYGCITAEKKQFHDGEPVFILRATDPLAPAAIREYAELCGDHECNWDHIEACGRHAVAMEQWQKEHPELVKAKPD